MKTSITSFNKDYETISKKAYEKTNKKLSNKLLKEVKELSYELSSKFKTTGEYILSLQMPRSKRNKKNKQKALTSIQEVFASCSPKVEADKEEFGFNPVGKKEYNLQDDEFDLDLDQDDEYDLDFEI